MSIAEAKLVQITMALSNIRTFYHAPKNSHLIDDAEVDSDRRATPWLYEQLNIVAVAIRVFEVVDHALWVLKV